MADPDPELPPVLQELVDKQALYDLTARLFRGVDRLDDELIASCLAPGFRYGIRVGMTPEEFANNARAMQTDNYMGSGLACVAAQHAITNQLFEIDGDVAYGETYIQLFAVTEDGALHTMIMRYGDRYIRTSDGWRLLERDPTVDWSSPLLEAYGANFPAGRRDREDVTYRRAT